MFAAGIVIRLVLARTSAGHSFDMAAFSSWATRLAQRGASGFYPGPGESFSSDYPPGYLYVLWAIGASVRAAGGDIVTTFMLKLPPIAADVGLAWVVMRLSQPIAGDDDRVELGRMWAAGAILLNPAVFFVSAVWGQADSVPAFFVAAAMLSLSAPGASVGRECLAAALLALAVATKPQAAFVIPVVVLVLAWRHLVSSRAERRLGARLGRLAVFALTGLASGLAVVAPFGLGLVSTFEFYARAAGTYELTSLFAFNLWGAFGFWRPDSGADAFRILGVPAFVWGLGLFSLGGALVLARAWSSLRRGVTEARILLFGSVAFSVVAFALLTRIHERYLFMAVALGAALTSVGALRAPFVLLSGLFLLNLLYPYAHHFGSAGRPAPWWAETMMSLLGGRDLGAVQLRAVSVLTAVACIVGVWICWRRVEELTPSNRRR